MVDAVEEVEQEDLGVTLASVTGLAGFGRLANFDDDNIRDDAA